MKTRHEHIITGLFLGIITLGLFCCCADDNEHSDKGSQHELHLSLGQRPQTDMTRALPDGYLPAGFEEYNHANALSPITQIQTYLTGNHPGFANNEPLPCLFNYDYTNTTADTWTSRVTLESGDYYLYGYMPKELVVGSVDIAKYDNGTTTDFANGCVLTFNDLNAVSPSDICVIVGVEQYKTSPQSEKLGNFKYNTNNGDNLVLLVDHIYAGLQFDIKVDETYSKLRTIKVRSIKLAPDTGEGVVVETVKATVTVAAGAKNPFSIEPDDATSPTNSLVFSDYKKGTNPQDAEFFKGEHELTTTASTFLACLCPPTTGSGKKYIMETTYDVYDKSGSTTPIRAAEKARNTIVLKKVLNAGEKYTINITVKPTYLYMLSDPDLDNPTFEIGS